MLLVADLAIIEQGIIIIAFSYLYTDTSCIGSVLGKVAVEPCWRSLGDSWQHQG